MLTMELNVLAAIAKLAWFLFRQFRDLSAFTADLWYEFNVVVDIAITHGTMEATIRFDSNTKQKDSPGLD